MNYPTPSQLSGMASGDLDGDGNLDFVTANGSSNSFTVLLGRGDGTFKSVTTFSLSTTPLYVAVGDFNGDHKLDLAINCYGSNNVKVLLGNGDGTFGTPTSLPAGNNPRGILVGDFNQDNQLDIAITNIMDNTVEVFLGNGDGTFQAGQVTSVGATQPGALAAADLNGDGKLDLVTSNYFGNNCSVLLGNGDGTFAPAVKYAADSNPGGIGVQDLNNDGVPDIVIANHAGNLSVLLGNGDGTFKAQVKYPVGANPGRIVFDDFNHDGIPDVGVALYDDAKVALLYGNGDGTFGTPVKITVGAGSGELFAVDLNHDGVDDLIVGQQNVPAVGVLLQTLSVTGVSFTPNAILGTAPTQLVATLSSNANPASATTSTVRLVRAGPDGVLGTADDVAITPNGVSVSGCQVTLDLTGATLPNDKYRFTLASPRSLPTANLGAYWKFNEGSGTTTADSSGNSNTGTLTGGVTWTPGGVSGSALSFDGVNGAVHVPKSASLEPANGITVSLWGNISNSLGGNVGDLLRKESPYIGGYVLRWNNGNGRLGFHIDGNTAGQYWYCEDPTPNSTYLNAWHHYAGTYDCGTRLLKLYVDGVLKNTVTGGLSTLQHTDDLYLMFVPYASQVAVPGVLDEVRIFDHALSSAEIQGLVATHPGVSGTSGAELDGAFTGKFPSGNGAYADFNADFSILAPTLWVTNMSPAPGAALNSVPTTITVTTNVAPDPTTVNVNTVKLVRAGPDGVFGTADDVAITPAGVSANGTQITLDLGGVKLPDDQYQVMLISGPPTGNALHFNGVDNSVYINSFGPSAPTTEVTVEFWQKVSGVKAQSTFGLNPVTDGNRLMSHEPWQDGTIIFDFGDFASGRLVYNMPSGFVGVWNHMALVSSQSGSYVKIYRNGVLEAQKTGASAFTRGAYDLMIGSDGVNNRFGGDITEFRIWNVARTQAQIVNNMNRRLTGAESGLVGYWDFNECNGIVAHDKTGHGFDGTIYGATWVTSGATITGVADLNGTPLDGKFTGTFPSGDGMFANFTAGFTLTTPKLTVTNLTPAPGAALNTPPASIVASFSKAIDPASFNVNSVRLLRAGPDGVCGTADDVAIVPNALTVAADRLSATVDLTGVKLRDDTYQLILAGTNPPSTGLVSNLKLDEGSGSTSVDATGNGNNLTLFGGSTWTTGVSGNALSFDGTGYATFGATPGLNFGANAPFTISGWVNTTDSYGPIVTLRNSVNASSAIQINVGYDGSEFATNCLMGLIKDDSNQTFAHVSGGVINTGTWRHFALTRNTTGTIELFLDGVSQGTNQSANSAGPITTDLRCLGSDRQWVASGGGQNNPAYQYLNGRVDEVRIYNRQLSNTEITALAGHASAVADANGNPLDGNFTGTFPSGDGTFANFTAGFTLATPKLTVTGMTPAPGATLNSVPTTITVTTNFAPDPTTVGGNARLVRAGPDGIFGTGDDQVVLPAAVSVLGNTITLDMTGVPMPNDTYQVQLIATGGNALQFDGTKTCVEMANYGTVAPTSEITVEFWQKLNNSNWQSPFALNPDQSGNRIQAYIPHSDGKIYWDYGDDSAAGRLSYTPPGPLTGSWQHFALVSSRSGNFMSIYRNGVLEATKTGASTFSPSVTDLMLGFDYVGQPFYLGGQLDEFRIWNVARTQAQIQSTMHAQLSGAEPGLYNCWSFNEPSGQVVLDSAPMHFNGTLGTSSAVALDDPLRVASAAPIGITDTNGTPLDGKFTGTFPSGDGSFANFSAGFTLTTPNLTVTGITPAPGAALNAPPASIVANFSKPLDPTSFNANTVRLVRAGPDGQFGTADDVSIPPHALTVANDGLSATVDLSGVKLRDDTYQLTLAGGTPSSGLIGRWGFNEGSGTIAHDSSGNGNDGTLSSPTWTGGVVGSALNFNGVNDVVTVNQAAVLEPTNGVTVATWANITDTRAGKISELVRKDGPFQYGYILRWADNGNNGLVEFIITRNGIPTIHCTDTQGNAGYLNTWHHFAGSYDASSGVAKLYVDGVLHSTVTGTAGPLQHTDKLYFMNYPFPGSTATPGKLDEVCIYNRALNLSEIQQLARQTPIVTDSNGNPLDGKFTGTFPSGDGTFTDFSAGFTLTTPKLTVTNMSPAPNALLVGAPASITATFNKPLDPSSVNTNTVRIVRAGSDGLFGTSDDVAVIPNSVTAAPDGLSVTADLTGLNLPGDRYQLRISSGNGPVNSGLTAWWKLDATSGASASDSSGLNQTGLWHGSSLAWTAGRVNGALQFISGDSYVEAPDNAAAIGTSDFSVAFWVNFTDSNLVHLISNRKSTVHANFWEITANGGSAIFEVDQDSVGTNYNHTATTVPLNNGVWHHFAAVRQGPQCWVYVDGVLNATATGPGIANITNASAIELGNTPYIGLNGSQTFHGKLDEVRIFGRALSAAEIQQLAGIPGVTDTNGNPLDGKFTGTFPSGDGTFSDFVATFRVDIPPVANSQAVSVHSDGVLPITLTASDADNDPLSFTLLSSPAHGMLVGTPPNLTYIPGAFAGADSFSFKVNDGVADSNVATVSINVSDVAPVAIAGAAIVHSGGSTPVVLIAADADSDPLAYSIVSLPAHGTLTGTLPNLVYTAGGFTGTDSFTFKANDRVLDSNVATFTITVANNPPTVTAAASPTSLLEFQQVAFTSTSSDPDGDALTVSWDFGDGASSTVANPVHAYAAAGTYTATVTVTDAGGLSAQATVVILVYQQADLPTARFVTSDLTGFAGQPIGFDATFSTDPDNNLVAYDWDFGDGSRHGSGQLISRVYTAPGTYTVTLTVTNGFGLSDTTSLTMVVLPASSAGLFPSTMKYSVNWNRAAANADHLKLDAVVNVGDIEVTSATQLRLGIVGQSFTGTTGTTGASRNGPAVQWKVKPGKKGSPKGTLQIFATISHISVGAAFAKAGATGATSKTLDLPVLLGVGTESFQASISSQFRFGNSGMRATGGGTGPK